MPEIRTTNSLQLRTLKARPTLATGQCCDLKLEDGAGDRWWLCRMTPGETDHRVTVEAYQPATGGWATRTIYRDPEQ